MNPINSFSFNQLNKLVDIVNNPHNSRMMGAEDDVADVVSLSGNKEVIILPGKDLLKSIGTPQQAAEHLKAQGIEMKEDLSFINGVVAKADKKEIEQLEKKGFLVYDNSPRNLLPDIPAPTVVETRGTGKPWDMPEVKDVEWTGAKELHAQGLTGKGAVFAVLDSGYNGPVPLKGWHDVVADASKNIDPNGHGTHVTGDIHKIAPDGEFVAVRVMNEKGQGRPSDIVKGVEWVIKNKDRFGIDVINMSLGAGPDGIPYYMDPINKAVEQAIKQGIDVVVAAGNSGPSAHTIGSPADDPQVLTVGAALNPTKVSDFSSRGTTEDGLVKPDIIAPGEFIVSWASPNSQMDNIAKTVDGIRKMTPEQLTLLLQNKPELIQALGLPNNVLQLTPDEREKVVKTKLPPMYKPTPDTIAGPGTSFASPEVAGLAGIIKEAVPNATFSARKEAFMKTADSMGSNYTQVDQGSGFVDADEALEFLKKNA